MVAGSRTQCAADPSFGGDVVKERRMTTEELVAEATWLLECGVHPLMVAQMLNRKMPTMSRLMRRHGQVTLAQVFDRSYTVAA